jgi:hypothetical protein
MKKYLYSFFILISLIIITSIAYLGSFNKPEISNFAKQLIGDPSLKINNVKNDQNPSVHKSFESVKCLKKQMIQKYKNFQKSKFITNETSKTTSAYSSNLNYNYIDKYPFILSCNLSSYSKFSRDDLLKNYSKIKLESINYDYTQESPKHLQIMRIVRAIIIYYPIEISNDYIYEFKWMYRSWIEMQKTEPSYWRTDIVIFINNDYFQNNNNFFLTKLNCSFNNIRKTNQDKPMCTLVDYKPLKSRQIVQTNFKTYNLTQKYEYLLNSLDIFSDDELNIAPFYEYLKEQTSDYGYLDSILIAFDGYNFLKNAGYNFLIRSDMDVFFTPSFGKWLPRNCNDFYVGRGGFSTPFNINRLNRIAKILGFQSASEENLGSTWYSSTEQFRLVSYLTLFSMAYLSESEFSPPEKLGQLGVLLWPYWVIV